MLDPLVFVTGWSFIGHDPLQDGEDLSSYMRKPRSPLKNERRLSHLHSPTRIVIAPEHLDFNDVSIGSAKRHVVLARLVHEYRGDFSRPSTDRYRCGGYVAQRVMKIRSGHRDSRIVAREICSGPASPLETIVETHARP